MDVSGGAWRGVLITIVFAKVKKSNNKKQQMIQKNQKKEKKIKKRERESFPGLCFKPLRGAGAPFAWGSRGAAGLTSGPAEAGFCPQHFGVAVWCGVGRLGVWPRGQGSWHRSGCVPHPAHLRAKQGHGWPFRSGPVGRAAHVCTQRRGRRISLPGLQLSSKPKRIALFHSFKMPSETNVARLLEFF